MNQILSESSESYSKLRIYLINSLGLVYLLFIVLGGPYLIAWLGEGLGAATFTVLLVAFVTGAYCLRRAGKLNTKKG